MADDNEKLEQIEVHSYERLFRLERKLTQVQGYQLPIAIPVVALVWGFLGLLLTGLLSVIPGISLAYNQIPFILRWVFFPGLLAYLATRVESQGRPIHKFFGDWLKAQFTVSARSLGRKVPAPGKETKIDWSVWLSRDHNVPYLRRSEIIGPAHVVFRDPVWAKPDKKGDRVTVIGRAPNRRPVIQRLTQRPKGFNSTRRVDLPEGTTMRVMPL